MSDERTQIEMNVELVQALKQTMLDEPGSLPTAIILPVAACADADRWFDQVGWHEIRPGTRSLLGVQADADFRALVTAAYDTFPNYAAVGVSYHF
jgi:hypothetical protein